VSGAVLRNTVRTMRALIPTSPQARAVVGLVAVMAVAVGVLAVLSTGSPERAEVVPTGEESAATTTTRTPTTTPATVLGAVIERDDVPDPDDSPPVATTTTAAPPATTSAPATAAPAPLPTTAAPPAATEAPSTTEATTTTAAPAPTTVVVTVQVSSTDPVEVVLSGADITRQVLLPPDGSSATFADLPAGTYRLAASWTVPAPDDQDPDGPRVGPSGRAEQSDPFALAPGERLSAVLDGGGWTLVLG
jgi:hypothetical protein